MTGATSGPAAWLSARRAASGDGPALDALAQAARGDASAKKGGDRLNPGDRDDLVVVGLIGDDPVGYARCSLTATVVAIDEIFVHPHCRGVGVGAAMLALVESEAAAAGCRWVDAVALPGDRDTKNFFESHGLTARAILVSKELGR